VDIAQTVHRLFNEYCPNCPQAVQRIFPNTLYRLSSGYYPILSTGCSMNIAQNTVHRLLISPRLSNAYSAVLTTGYWVFSGLQIKSKCVL